MKTLKNLTKGQWISFGLLALGFILESLTTNGTAFGLGAVGVQVVGLLSTLFQFYISFSAQNVADFASENAVKNSNAKIKSLNVTVQDVKNWRKNR